MEIYLHHQCILTTFVLISRCSTHHKLTVLCIVCRLLEPQRMIFFDKYVNVLKAMLRLFLTFTICLEQWLLGPKAVTPEWGLHHLNWNTYFLYFIQSKCLLTQLSCGRPVTLNFWGSDAWPFLLSLFRLLWHSSWWRRAGWLAVCTLRGQRHHCGECYGRALNTMWTGV